MKGWQKIYSTQIVHRAEIVKEVLAGHQIAAVIVNKKDSAYQYGFYEVHVNADDVLWAIKYIENDIQFE